MNAYISLTVTRIFKLRGEVEVTVSRSDCAPHTLRLAIGDTFTVSATQLAEMAQEQALRSQGDALEVIEKARRKA